jgi:hypothetical protein
VDAQMKKSDIIKAAREALSAALEADKDNREEGHDDLEFIAGRQWPETEREERNATGRPVITINRMPQFVRQVTGDIRRVNPSVRVIPGDTKATEDVAAIYQGLIRAIESDSDASSVYEDAAVSAAQCGIGHWRVLTEYEDPMSFNQVIKIGAIRNPFAVVWDPASRDPARADAKFCFITERMTQDDFEKAYPDKPLNNVEVDLANQGLADWYTDGDVIVAEYFWKEPVTKKIYLLATGEVVDEKPPAPVIVLKEREVETHKVMWAKVSGTDVLDGPTEMPGMCIPVVSCVGEEIHIGDEVVRTSVIRYAKDAQRLYNYYKSAHAEFVALQPKAPYLVTAKQVAGFEAFWNEANDSNRPYLPYTPDEKAPGPPARAIPPQPSMAMVQELMSASEDMKATTGIYDAGLGQQSNEKSGVAIRQRQMESDISTSIYSDNLQRSIHRCGQILIDLIPRIYDTARMVRIVGEDEQETLVSINSVAVDQVGNVVPVNDLKIGKYDVRVSVGPNYSTRRQEVADSMMQFVQAFPQAAQMAGDLIAEAMDWPDSEKLAERLKRALPPEIVGQKEPETPEEAQAMQQAQAAQQRQMQEQQVAQELAKRRTMADLAKAEADAKKAMAEVREAEADAVKADAEARMAVARVQMALAPPPVMAAPPQF